MESIKKLSLVVASSVDVYLIDLLRFGKAKKWHDSCIVRG